MRYLLDTHTLIWFLEGDNRLSAAANDIVSHADNDIYVSIVSLWEMAIKISLGKLDVLVFEGVINVVVVQVGIVSAVFCIKNENY